ncbi:MAG: YciI-like protein [Vicinamibacterales bacterium]|nr:YciI-like protein [Vicinamibacterales bacterium]
MPYFALIYDVVDGFVDKRTPFRPAHLSGVREAQARGELIMAGALADPAGALLVFRGADKSVAEDFAKADPYVHEGLVKSWAVRPWTVVVGQDPSETPPGLPK